MALCLVQDRVTGQSGSTRSLLEEEEETAHLFRESLLLQLIYKHVSRKITTMSDVVMNCVVTNLAVLCGSY